MISVIVPVHNQGKTIQAQIERLYNLGVAKEIIVVNDGSQDNTAAALRELSWGGLKVIHHVSNRGPSAAVRTALEHASGDFIFIPNGNLEDNPGSYLKLLDAINSSGADIVLGTRSNQPHQGSRLKQAKNYFLAKILNIVCGVRLHGWFSHFQLIRRASLLDLSLQLKGPNIAFEIIIRGLRKKMRVAEVFITND